MTKVKEDFHRDGFAIARGAFSRAEVEDIAHHIAIFIRDRAQMLKAGEVYYEQGAAPRATVKALHGVDRHDPFFAALKRDPRLLELVQSLWPSEEILSQEVMFFGKPAGEGSEAPAHQDNAFQCWQPALALTATLALDESTPENGALTCLRGSHRLGDLPHIQSGVMGFSRRISGPVDVASYPEVMLCMKPGDVALHHVQTIHRSGANGSDRSRRQLGIGYRAARAAPDAERIAAYQQGLERLHKPAM